MGQFEMIEDPDDLNFLLENLDDEVLEDLIQGEKSLEKLNCYLKWKYVRINNNISKRRDFSVNEILNNKESTSIRKSVLKWALLIQNTNCEFISCMQWFDEKLRKLISCKEEDMNVNVEELFNIAEVILIVKQERGQELLVHMDIENLKILLFQLTSLKLNSRCYINLPSIFLSYFDEIYIWDPDIVDVLLHYLIEKENFDFLLIIFNKRLHQLAKSTCFQEESLWSILKKNITNDVNMKKKQALHILSEAIEYFKENDSTLIPEDLRSPSLDDWNFYFILLHLSEEKQLHLIKPTLKFLPLIVHLHISWQLCLYKILLNHSQLYVVYKTVEHLLNLKFDVNDNFRDIIRSIFIALNKYEYSDLSQNAYDKFSIFCNALDYDCNIILFEEFVSMEWNPAAAWCFLNSTSSLLSKIPEKFIYSILHTVKSLPHTFIKNSCLYLFFKRFFENFRKDLFEDLVHIGQFLLFSDSDVDEELFRKVVVINEVALLKKKIQLRGKVLEAIQENNEKLLHILLEIMEILKIPIDLDNIPCSNIGDIILLHFSNLRDNLNLLDFLLLRLKSTDNDEYYYLSKYLDKLFLDLHKTNIKFTYSYEYYEKLWNISKHNHSKTLVAIKVIAEADRFESFMQLLESEKQSEKQTNYFDNLKVHLYRLWINHRFKYIDKSKRNENFTMLLEKLHILLDLGTEQSLYLVVENLELLLKCTSDEQIASSLDIYDGCLTQISQLPSKFLRSYSIVFFRSIFHLKLFSSTKFIEYWKCWQANYFENHFSELTVMRVILKGCRKLILLQAPNVDILIPLLLQGLLSGAIVQKNERVEYRICQEIHKVNSKYFVTLNPNIISMEVKMLSMESLYLLTKNYPIDTEILLVKMLLNLYNKHYKTRYFPDSKIHFEKLRIVQALLLVGPCTTGSDDQLVEFILNSFCEESHQPSVKQLLQWLLIIFMSKTHEHIELVIEKINNSNLLNPSSLTALIPVLYHVVLFSKPVKFWFLVTDALLPWTMGANFKLRVYSQVTLGMLLKRANEKKLTEYVAKYSFLENSIYKVLEASGNAVEETMKNDLSFIESFNHKLCYSIENIFMNLPRILHVPSSEWENIAEYEFSDHMDIEIKNDLQLPNFKKIADNATEKFINISDGINVQKKIIPWKYALEDNTGNNTLGNLICVASLLEKSSNLGGLSRTCEIFCVKQLVLHNWKIKDDKEFKNLSMSSENWVNVMEVKREDLEEFLVEMRKRGYSLIGLEQTCQSVKLNDHKFENKTVLLLGNEKEGIPAPLLPLMNTCVEIPQFGQTRSLNVHVAGAIFIWEYVRQHSL